MLRGGARTSLHPPAPIQGTSAPACLADPGAHPTIATHNGDAGGGARPAAGTGAGGDPGSGPEAAWTQQAARRPEKKRNVIFNHRHLIDKVMWFGIKTSNLFSTTDSISNLNNMY